MTLQAYQSNTTYERTQLKYDATITPITQENISSISKKDDKSKEIEKNAPVIYTNANNLSDPQKFQKFLLENILGRFNNEDSPKALFPNENIDENNKTGEKSNPYTQNMTSLPQGFLYNSSSEYYEKTSFEFNFQATIKTPNAEYNIEINFSYTREFYEKNETQIAYTNDSLRDNPLNINLEKDDESLKDLKSLHFIFDIYKEDEKEKDTFDQLKETLSQRRKMILEMFKEDENKNIDKQRLDNFQIWQENSNHQMSLIAVQKEGLGVFLANSSSESSYINLNVNPNGYSFEASYSSSKSSYTQIQEGMNKEK